MDANDDTYKPLYAQAAELKNVNYRGWHSNDYICKHITDYQIFPYQIIGKKHLVYQLLKH